MSFKIGIAAAIYSKDVICTGKFTLYILKRILHISYFLTDIDLGGILNVIAENVKRNSTLTHNNVKVLELDFKATKFSEVLDSELPGIDIVICADGKIIFFRISHISWSVYFDINRPFSDLWWRSNRCICANIN